MMRILLLTSFLLIAPLFVYGQAQTISLEEAIQIALDNNYQLKQAANSLGLAEFRELSARADFLPSLSANVNRGRRIGRGFDEVTGDFGDFTINSFNTSISSNLVIFNSFANVNNLRASRYETLSQKEQLERVRENIIFDTASRYLQYILNRELLEIVYDNLETAKSQLEQIRAQVEVGARPTVDQLNQESIVANTELQVINSENSLDLSRLQLIQTLQIDPLGDYEFTVPSVDEANIIPSEFSLTALVTAALDNRSDLKSEERNIDAVYHNMKATRANYYPSLSLSGSVSSGYSDTGFLSYTDQFFEDNIVRNFGLTLSIPIFNRFNVRENVQAQEVAYKNAVLSLENTKLNIVQEVHQAYNDYQAIVKELESTERALIAAQRAFETEEQRYEVGASTLIELNQANNAYVEAQSNRIQTIYNFIFQEHLLDYFLGRLNANLEF